MSNFDVATAFVRVLPDLTAFREQLQAQVTAAVDSVVMPPVQGTAGVAGTKAAAAASTALGTAAVTAAAGMETLSVAQTGVTEASVREAAAALAVTRALETQRVAEVKLAAAKTANKDASVIAALQAKASIAADAVVLAQQRLTLAAEKSAKALAAAALAEAEIAAAAAAAAAATAELGGASVGAAAGMENLSAATLVAEGATGKEAAAALALARALETQRIAEEALTAAILRNADAQEVQALTTKATFARSAADVARIRQAELLASGLTNVGASGEKAAKGLASASVRADVAQGSLIGLTRITGISALGLTAYSFAAVVAGLALKGAIGSAAQLEQQLNTFQAVSGATTDQLKAVSEATRALGADLALPATSANDAAAAMTELAKAGLSVNDTLAASRGVLQLSAAANIEAGQAATIVASQLNAYGLAGSRATSITDLLAGASIAAQGEISDFAAAFQQAAAAAHTADISVETTTGLLTELAKAGIRGADAGTSLRTTILRLVPTTKQAAEFQKALGIQLDRNATIGSQLPSLIEQYRTALLRLPPADKIEALNQIFGQDAFRAASIIFSQQKDALAGITTEVSAAGSGAKLAEARMKGLAGATEGLKSSAQTLGTTLGTSLLPLLTSVVTTLSDVTTTATKAAGGLQKLGDVTIKPVVGLVGGSDVVAQVALAAGIGLGTKALLARRAAHKAVQAAAVAEEEAIAAASVASAEVQVVATSGITAAMERQLLIQRAIAGTYALEGIAAQRSAATVIAATSKKVAGVLAANKALGAGLALSVAGGVAPGAAGSILSAAGAGAIAGSFIPVPGAPIIGAVALGAIAAMQAAQAQNAKDKAALKTKWQSLTFEEQQAFLRRNFPNLAKPDATRDELGNLLAQTAKDSAKGSGKAAVGKPGATAESFVLAQGGFNLPPPDETLKNLIAALDVQIPPLTSISTTSGVETIKNLFKKRASILPKAKAEVLLSRKAQLDLNVALAQLSGSTVDMGKALEAQAAFELKEVARLQAQLANATPAGFVIKNLKERDAKGKEIVAAIQAYNATMAQITQEAAQTFTIPTDVTIAGIKAAATPDLGDNLTTAKATAAAAHQNVKEAEAALKAKKTTQAVVDGLRVEAAQADAAVVAAQKAIGDDAVSKAQQAANVQVGNVKRLADAAGNQGKAERALIALLKKRVQDAKANSQELLDARNALDEELKNQQRALVERTKLQIDLQNSILDTKLLRAQATPGIEDDKGVLNRMIAAAEKDKRAQQKIADNETLGAKIRLEAALQVQADERTIFGLKQDIKKLQGGGSGGFTLQQLFQEAASEFNAFGSNIAGKGGVLSGQDARAQLGASILDNASNALPQAQLTEAEKQTALLKKIADHFDIATGTAAAIDARPGSRQGTVGSFLASDFAIRAAVDGLTD